MSAGGGVLVALPSSDVESDGVDCEESLVFSALPAASELAAEDSGCIAGDGW